MLLIARIKKVLFRVIFICVALFHSTLYAESTISATHRVLFKDPTQINPTVSYEFTFKNEGQSHLLHIELNNIYQTTEETPNPPLIISHLPIDQTQTIEWSDYNRLRQTEDTQTVYLVGTAEIENGNVIEIELVSQRLDLTP